MVSVLHLVSAVFVCYGIWLLITFWKKYQLWWKICQNPNVKMMTSPHWFWGHIRELRDLDVHILKTEAYILEEKPRITAFWIFFFQVAFQLTHPDTAKTILKSSEPKPRGFAEPYYVFVPWLGDGLVLSDGPKWERNRKLLTPAFHFDVLPEYISIFDDAANALLTKLWNIAKTGDSVDVMEPLTDATLDAVLRCAVSLDSGIQTSETRHPYPTAVRRITQLMMKRFVKPWTYVDFIYRLYADGREYHKNVDFVHKFAEDIIHRRRAALKDDPTLQNKKKRDFLDILLTAEDENGEGLTDREIRDEVDTFLFAGNDTTSSALTFEFYCLGKYPEEQEKVYQEVRSVMGDRDIVEWSDLNKLPLMTCFIKETLRLYPPVVGINRKLTKDTEIDGVSFPAGISITVLLSSIHKHPDAWDSPLEFMPERFANTTEKNPYSFVPFSAGPRNCIGQNFALNEQKVFLCKLLNRYKVALDDSHEVNISLETTLKAKNGVKVRLEPRNK